jgi:predicted lipid-binding transport protein (Tim44 family)
MQRTMFASVSRNRRHGHFGRLSAIPISGRVVILASVLAVALPAASAQDIFIYPTRGQSQQQQDRDRYECHSWATQQTGFDPTRPAAAPAAAPPPPPVQQGSDGSMLRGAARGAAIGAVGGAIGGNAGKGAAIGAGTGALVGGMRRQDQMRQQQAQQQAYNQQQSAAAANQNSATAAQRNNYNRAMSARLSGRGYTVS